MGKYTLEILQRINVRRSLSRRSVLLLELYCLYELLCYLMLLGRTRTKR
jgi:hypothetical protein